MTWAAIDHNNRVIALLESATDAEARAWFVGLQRGRTRVPLALRPGQGARVGALVHVDDEWTGHLVADVGGDR